MQTNELFDPQNFVNRTDQLNEVISRVQSVLDGLNNSAFIKFYSGGAGLGKTWLLKQISVEMEQRNLSNTYVDLSNYAGVKNIAEIRQSIIDFLQNLIKQFNPDRDISDCSLDELSWYMENDFEEFVGKNKTWVLLVDNIYTPSWEFLKELENHVFGPLSTQQSIVMVFAGHGSKYAWRTPELQLEHEELLPFEIENGEIENQIRKLSDPAQHLDIKMISLGSGGIPGLISYLVRFGSPEGYRNYLQDYLGTLNLLENPDLILDLRCFAYLPYFTDSHISAITAIRKARQKYGVDASETNWRNELDIVGARKTRETLLKSGIFVLKSDIYVLGEKKSGFVLDSIVRRAIQGSLQFEDWIETKKLVSLLYDYFWDEYQTGLDGLELQAQSNYPSKQTRNIIGYRDEYSKVCDLINNKQPKIVYIYGPGGIGKTRFIEEIRQNYLKMDDYYVLETIDLFHPIYQQKDSLQREICESFRNLIPTDNSVFAKYKEESDAALADYIRLGATRHLSGKITKIWDSDYSDLEARKTIVLFLDTAEKLFYPNPWGDKVDSSRTNGPTDSPTDVDNLTDSLSWIFKKFIPNIKNTIVVISGRLPETDNNVEEQLRSKKDLVESVELKGFEDSDIYEYWERLTAANSYDTFFFNILNSIQKNDLEDFYRFYTSENFGENTVSPLALAILVDLAVFNRGLFDGDLYKKLQDEFDDWAQNTQTILATYNSKSPLVLKFLVKKLMELDTPDIIVREFAKARKGVNESLFLALTKRGEADRPKIRRLLSSDFVANLSIVKLHKNRDEDGIEETLLYLHDAVYEHLDFSDLERGTTKRQDDYKTIDAHYRQEMKNVRDEIVKSYNEAFSVGKVMPINPKKVFRLMTKWDELAAERLYYSLDSNFTIERSNDKPSTFEYSFVENCFRLYYFYSEEALASQDKVLDRILETELLSYWYEHKEALQRVNFDILMKADFAVRSVKRKFYFEDYESTKGNIRKDINDLRQGGERYDLIQGDKVAQYDLELLEILLNLYSDDYLQSASKLENMVVAAKELKNDPRSYVIIARASNMLGLLHRKQGAYFKAINAYQAALKDWRRNVELESEQANTFTNVSFVLAEVGRHQSALDWGIDAKDLRLRRGILPGIGQAYNVLGHIYLRQGQYEETLICGRTAQLMLGTDVYDPSRVDTLHLDGVNVSETDDSSSKSTVDSQFVTRMQGLNATLLAECYRRMAGKIRNEPRIVDTKGTKLLTSEELLIMATWYADLGRKIFEGLKQIEGVVEGWIELGCSYRDRIMPGSPIDKKLINRAEAAFDTAISLAQSNKLVYRELDAKVNKAWLDYYCYLSTRDEEYLKNARSDANDFLRAELLTSYLISPHHSPAILNEGNRPVNFPIFALLGKDSLLSAMVDYRTYETLSQLSSNPEEIRQSNLPLDDLLQYAEQAIGVLVDKDISLIREKIDRIETSAKAVRLLNFDGKMKLYECVSSLDNLKLVISLIDNLSYFYGFRVAQGFSMALEYNLIRGETISRDMTRAMTQIHQKLKQLTDSELVSFLGYKDEVKVYYGLYIENKKGEWFIEKFLRDWLFIERNPAQLEETIKIQ